VIFDHLKKSLKRKRSHPSAPKTDAQALLANSGQHAKINRVGATEDEALEYLAGILVEAFFDYKKHGYKNYR
jgi:hypothetical protein